MVHVPDLASNSTLQARIAFICGEDRTWILDGVRKMKFDESYLFEQDWCVPIRQDVGPARKPAGLPVCPN